MSDDIQILGPEHAECVIAYGFLREQLAERTDELEEARAEIARLAAELEQWPTALVVDGPGGEG